MLMNVSCDLPAARSGVLSERVPTYLPDRLRELALVHAGVSEQQDNLLYFLIGFFFFNSLLLSMHLKIHIYKIS